MILVQKWLFKNEVIDLCKNVISKTCHIKSVNFKSIPIYPIFVIALVNLIV
jgi:hypothetical protein